MQLDRYRGDGHPPKGSKKRERYPYLAEKKLSQVVNMAIVLRRPLLIKGPPGCGKTQLAYSIAHELDVPLHPLYVKSTSRAKDGLYTVNLIHRLLDVQMTDPKSQDLWNYVKFQALGLAFRSSEESVLLIDEIDKADIDFPNDLLREIEEKVFEIEELDEQHEQRKHEARSSPIIVITSNDEKELPDAFLRRCLFYYIPFPDEKMLKNIVNVNLASKKLEIEKKLLDTATKRLLDLREVEGYRKSPATSELIDWVEVLHYWGTDLKELAEVKLDKLPFLETLFKYQQDLQNLERHVASEEN